MIPVNLLIALWAALVAVGFVFGATFPSGTTARIAEFVSPIPLSFPPLPGLGAWLGRIFQPLAAIALAVLLTISARGAGRVVSSFMVFPRATRWWMAVAVGGGLLSFLLFGLGLTGILFQPLVYILFIHFIVAGFARFSVWKASGAGPGRLLGLAAGLTMVAWISGVLVPEPGIDAYLYHLRLPFYYLHHHRIYSVWHHIHGHVPQAWEFLLTVFPRQLSATGAQALSALTALAIWRMAMERAVGGWVYRAGWILLMSSPLVFGTGVSAYTDLPLMWLEFGAFILLIPAAGAPGKSARFWAGAILGLATSLKYASFPAFFAAAIVLSIQAVRLAKVGRDSGVLLRSFSFILPLVAGFCSVFWPWLAWNALETGNPVFPFLGRLFPQALAALPFADRLSDAVFNRTFLNMFQSTWNALVRGEAFLFLFPLLVAAIPLLLSRKWRKPGSGMALVWAASFVTAWSMFMADERFILGVIPVFLFLLSPAGSIRFAKTGFVLLLLLNFYGILRQQFIPLDRLWAAAGLVSRAEYLEKTVYPSPGYMKMAGWLNSNTGEQDRILFVSDFKSPLIWRECIHDHVYDYPTRLVYLLWKTPPTPARVAVRFRQLGIRWVVYLPTINLARLKQIPDLFPFELDISRAWAGFWRVSAIPRAGFPPVYVYELSRNHAPLQALYHLPGVEDAARSNAIDILRVQGQPAATDYLRRLSAAYPWVGSFHLMYGEALMANPATVGAGREQIRISRKAGGP